MSKVFNQFQSDVSGAASGLMTQMLCAERGIDYNQLMYAAQQQHMNGILQVEQQRQMTNVMKRHYQGNGGTFVGKIREVFSPSETNLLMPMPSPGMGAPQIGMQPFGMPSQFGAQPQFGAPMNPMQTSQFLVAQPAPVTAQASPVQEPAVPDMSGLIQSVVSEVMAQLKQTQQPVYTAPTYNQAPSDFVVGPSSDN